MIDIVPFASEEYLLMLGLMIVGRGMDFLSTWIATPNLVLEANPIARRLGWKLGLLVNFGMCLAVAFWPLPAIIIVTTSLLVAARNFKSAWLMRSLGEERYLAFMLNQMAVSSRGVFYLCLFAETLLIGLVGLAIAVFSHYPMILMAVGVGVMAYAFAVMFYSLIALMKSR